MLISNLNSVAEPIYKSASKNGVPIYSSNASRHKAEVVKLPTLTKEAFPDNTKNNGLLSCSSHGGINCTLGKDLDGSVICYDGFRESQERYVFSCNKAKLKILEASLISGTSSSSFIVRNLSSVNAKNLSIILKNSKILNAPNEIAGYDSAEVKVEGLLKNLSGVSVSCANC